MTEPAPLPDYLVEAVARRTYEEQRLTPIPWEDAEEAERQGAMEAAKLILSAKAAQTDIKR
ncbi:MAG: hypothetical protein AAF401_15305 [Pseudomonadota bacterium]